VNVSLSGAVPAAPRVSVRVSLPGAAAQPGYVAAGGLVRVYNASGLASEGSVWDGALLEWAAADDWRAFEFKVECSADYAAAMQFDVSGQDAILFDTIPPVALQLKGLGTLTPSVTVGDVPVPATGELHAGDQVDVRVSSPICDRSTDPVHLDTALASLTWLHVDCFAPCCCCDGLLLLLPDDAG